MGSFLLRRSVRRSTVLGFMLLAGVLAQGRWSTAATYTWSGASGAAWSTSSTNWAAGGALYWDLADGSLNVADFNTSGASANVSGPIYTNGIQFDSLATVSSSTINLVTGNSFVTPTITMNASSGTINSILAGSAGMIKAGAGDLILTGANTYTGSTSITSGTLQIGNGGATGSLTAGTISIGSGATLAYNVATGVPVISSSIGGAGIWNLAGPGTSNTSSYSITGNNNLFTGTLNINSGARYSVGAATGLPSSSATINVASGGSLFMSAAFTSSVPITINGIGWNEPSGNLGAIRLTGSIYAGPITLGSNARIGVYGSSGTLSGNISGPYQLELWNGSGTSTLAISGSNSYGSTAITGAIAVTASSANALSAGGLTMSTGTLKTNGYSFSFADLAGASGQLWNGSATIANTLTIGSDNSSTIYSGTVLNGGAAALNLVKVGTGSLAIIGSNNYTGTTAINGGTLQIGGGAYPGAISGTGGLGQSGAGVSYLSGSNTYSGGTTIAGIGTLVFVNSNAFPATPTSNAITMTGGALAVTGPFTTVNGLLNSGLITASPTGGALAITSSSSENINLATAGTGSYQGTYGYLSLGSNGNNTYSGILTPAASTYYFGGGNGTITLTQSLTGANNLIAGNGGILGGVVLANTDSYTGGTILSGGSLTATTNSSLGTGTLIMNPASGSAVMLFTSSSPSLPSLSSSGAGASQIVLGNSAASSGTKLTIGSDNTSTTFSGVISDSNTATATGSLLKVGTGTLSLNGASTFVGGTTISAGEIWLQNSSAALGSSNSITLGDANTGANNVALLITYKTSLARPIIVNAIGGGTVTIGADQLGGASGNPTAFTGGITLNGPLTINSGTQQDRLDIGGVISGTGDVTLTGGYRIDFSKANTFLGNLYITGSNTLFETSLTNCVPSTANVIVGPGAIFGVYQNTTMNGLSGTGIVEEYSSTPTLTIGANNGSATFGGSITTSGFSLVKTGTGVQTLSGSNSFGGTTTVSGGSLVLSNSAALGSSTLASGGIVFDQSVGGAFTFGALSGSGSISLTDNGANNVALTVGNNGGSTTFSGQLSGGGSLAKIGAGTLTLTGTNIFAGPLYLNAGVLNFSNSGNLGGGTAAIFFNGGTLQYAAGNSYDITSGSVTLNAGGGLIDSGTNSVTFNGPLSGVGGLSKLGAGLLILTNTTNSYGGATTVSAGSLQFQASGSLPSTSMINLGSATLQIRNEGTMSGGSINVGNNITLSAASTTDTIDVGNNGLGNTGNTVLFGVLSNGTTANALAGTINFTGANGYLHQYSALNLPGSTGATTFLNPTTTSVTIAGNVTNQETGTVTGHYDTLDLDGTSGSNAIDGVIADSSGYVSVGNGDTRITKSNTSTWILNGANTFHGPTTISGGTLQLGNANAVQQSTVTTGTASMLTFSPSIGTFNVGGLSGSGSFDLDDISGGSISLQVGGNNTATTFAGAITGSGGLVKVGSANFTITGSGTYTGTTTVNGGTLTLAGNAPAGGISKIISPIYVNNATLYLGNYSELDYASGTPPVTLEGGTLGMSDGQYNYVKNITMKDGSLWALGTGALINSLTGANFSTSVITSQGTGNTTNVITSRGGAISASAGVTFNVARGLAPVDLSVSAILADYNGTVGTITKTGSGVLALIASNSYTGATTISGGTLQIGNGAAGSIGSSATIVDNAALVFNSSTASTYVGNISGSGTLTQNGPGAVIFTGSNSYTSPTIINGGAIAFNGVNSLPATGAMGDIVVAYGAAVGGTGPYSTLTAFLNSGRIAIGGSGAISIIAPSSENINMATAGSGNYTNMYLGSIGNNAYTGILTPSGTTYRLGGAAGVITMTNSGAVIDAGNVPQSLAVNGGVALTNINGYSGGTTLNGGTLNIVNDTALGVVPAGQTTNITFAGNSSLQVGAPIVALSAARNIAINSGVTASIDTNGGNTITILGTISGSGNLAKIGSGTAYLTGANTYTGTTIVDNGSLYLNSTTGPSIYGPVQMGGIDTNQPNFRMQASNQFSTSGAGVLMSFVNLSTNYTRFDLQGTNQTLAGISAASGGVSAIIQNYGVSTSTPPPFSSGNSTLTLNVAGGNSYSFSGYIRDMDSGSHTDLLSIVKTGAGKQTLSGANLSYQGTTYVNGGTLTLQDVSSFASPIVNSATVEFNAVAGSTIGSTAAMSGSGIWNKTGTGTVQFNGTEPITATGQFNIQAGKLQDNNNAVNWSNNLASMNISSGATMDLYADPVYIDKLTGSGTITNTYGNSSGESGLALYTERLTIGVNNGTSTFAGTIADTGIAGSGAAKGLLELDKIGSGTQSLVSANTYSGLTILNGGGLTLDFTASSAPLSNIVNSVSNSSALLLGGGTLTMLGNASTPNSQQFNGATVNANASSIVATGGTTSLSLGAVTRSAGATVDFTLPASGSITTSTSNANFAGGQATILGGYATVGGSSWAVSGTGAGPFAVSALAAYSDFTVAGGDVDSPLGTMLVNGSNYNSLRLNNAGSYGVFLSAGTTTIATGGILETANVGANAALISGNPLTSGNGQDLILIQNNTGGAMTISAPIVGAIGLTKAGPGLVALTGANSYSGTTTVTGGTLQMGAAGALPASVLNVNAGTFDFNGISYSTNAAVNLGGGPGGTSAAITLGSATLTLNNDVSYTNPNGALGATISGAGSVALVGTRNFTVGYGPAAGNDLTISAIISGAGQLNKAGPGTLLLSASDTYTGGTTITAGTLAIGVSNALPTSKSVTFIGNGVLSVGSFSQSVAGLVGSNGFTGYAIGAGTLNVPNTNVTIGGNASGASQTLDMRGLNNFNFSGSSTYSFLASANPGSNAEGYSTVYLAATNTITASVFGAGTISSDGVNGNGNSGFMYLGGYNTINANSITVGDHDNYAGLKVNPAANNTYVKIRGAAGGNSRANISVGLKDDGYYGQIGSAGQTSFDLTTGGGVSTLDALVGTLTLASFTSGTNYTSNLNSTFSMQAGTLDATTITIVNNTVDTSTVTGMLSDNGGLVVAQTFTMGVAAAGTINSTFNLTNGTLRAQTIAPGNSTGTSNRRFNWNSGMIGNYNSAVSGSAGLTISGSAGLTLTMAASGTHTFFIDAGQIGTVNANIAEVGGSASLVKAGSGLLTLAGTNDTYSGMTTVSAGTLQIGNASALGVGTGGLTANAGMVDLHGFSPTVGPISGAAGVITSLGGASTLTSNSVAASTFSGSIREASGNQLALTLNGAGALTLAGTNSYSGATTINAGYLIAGGANTLSPSSAFTVNSGVLDVTAGSQSIAGLSMGNGTLNLNLGNLLTVNGFANLGGNLNLPNLSTYPLTGGSIELMSYTSDTGAFSNLTSFTGYNFVDTGTQLDLFKNISGGPATWSSSAGGSWNTPGNWSTSANPSGVGALVTMGSALFSSGTVTLDSAQTVGALTFNSTASYTLTPGLSGTGSLLLSNTGGNPGMITVVMGTHSIAAPLTLAGTSSLVTLSSGGSLDISGNVLDGSGSSSLTLLGDGTGVLSLDGSNTFAGGMNVENGTLILNGASSLFAGSTLTIGVNPGPGAVFAPPALAVTPLASPSLAPVPEPGTFALLAVAAIAGITFARRRRRS